MNEAKYSQTSKDAETMPANTQSAPRKDSIREALELASAGRHVDAEMILSQAIAEDPGNGYLLNARGAVLSGMGRQLDAVLSFKEAIELGPGAPGPWTNLGRTIAHFKQYKTAVEYQRQAIARSKPDARILHNFGLALAKASRYKEAIEAHTRSLELEPDFHLARWDRALCHLYLGEYRQGWADYEARLESRIVPQRSVSGRKWDGAPYRGKRLLVLSEQGLGDAIWVARYLPRVKSLGGELILECRRELLPLFERMRLAQRLIAYGDPLPSADFHCYQCSLPGLFAPDFGADPASAYLMPPEGRLAKFGPSMALARKKLKVGIVWSGNVNFRYNEDRAQPLVRFLHAFALPGVQLYSLQKGPPEKELAALPPCNDAIVDLAPLIADFADTAAAVAQLDFVIMTDSSVAHLTAALGKPVWVLVGHAAHWLWQLGTSETLWYPTMRLFRSRAGGDWNHVFDMASVELLALARQRLGSARD